MGTVNGDERSSIKYFKNQAGRYNHVAGNKWNWTIFEVTTISILQNISEVWNVAIVSERLIGQVPEILYEKVFELSSHKTDDVSYHLFRIQFKTNLKTNFPVSMGYNLQPINPDSGIVYAAFVLVGLYILIIFDVSRKFWGIIFEKL